MTLARGEAGVADRAIRRQGTISVAHGSERDPHSAAALRTAGIGRATPHLPGKRILPPRASCGWVRGIAPCPAIDSQSRRAGSGARIGERCRDGIFGALRGYLGLHFFWEASHNLWRGKQTSTRRRGVVSRTADATHSSRAIRAASNGQRSGKWVNVSPGRRLKTYGRDGMIGCATPFPRNGILPSFVAGSEALRPARRSIRSPVRASQFVVDVRNRHKTPSTLPMRRSLSF